MRAVIQLLFLALYVVSSYSTMQSRIAFVVDDLQVSHTQTGDLILDDGGKVKPHYTHFREARKAGTEFNVQSNRPPEFAPAVAVRKFAPQTLSLHPQFDEEISHSRAPPACL
jgi:hypothetical protein